MTCYGVDITQRAAPELVSHTVVCMETAWRHAVEACVWRGALLRHDWLWHAYRAACGV